jgi:3-oxoadipate enol-lactonase
MSKEMWGDLAERLSGGFQVWSIDARGHGQSVWDGKPFTVEDMSEDLESVLDALGIGAVNIVGMSMGGNTAMTFAATQPERSLRLVLADTTANYGPDRHTKWEERATMALSRPRKDQLEFQLDRWFTPDFLAERHDDVRRISDIFLATDSSVHAAACRALGGFDGEPVLGQIRAETLVIVGSDDYATPPAMAKHLVRELSEARYLEIPDVRHMAIIESPSAWRAICAHLESD